MQKRHELMLQTHDTNINVVKISSVPYLFARRLLRSLGKTGHVVSHAVLISRAFRSKYPCFPCILCPCLVYAFNSFSASFSADTADPFTSFARSLNAPSVEPL